jgi:ABC-type Fe3+-hydroxamate transport system substrate-binding protein
MQRTVRVLSIACSLVVLFASSSAAQESQSVRGTVTSIAAGAITIKAASGDMTFAVDPKTNVVVTGGGTATRTAEAAGKSGPQLSSLLKAGDMVEVAYQGAPGSMRATSIRRVTTLSGGGGGGGGAAHQNTPRNLE